MLVCMYKRNVRMLGVSLRTPEMMASFLLGVLDEWEVKMIIFLLPIHQNYELKHLRTIRFGC